MAKDLVKIGAMDEQRISKALARLARENQRSVAAEVRIAIRKHLGLIKETKP